MTILDGFAVQTRDARATLLLFTEILGRIGEVPPDERFAAGAAAVAVEELTASLHNLHAELARLAGTGENDQ